MLGQSKQAHIKLSSRESECLFFLLRNKTAKEIGQVVIYFFSNR